MAGIIQFTSGLYYMKHEKKSGKTPRQIWCRKGNKGKQTGQREEKVESRNNRNEI